LLEAQLNATDNNVIVCDADENNYTAIKNCLLQPDRPDGIIASVEKLVPLVYLVCKELKLNIPSDIKLTGFTNLQTSPLLNPPLTTITQPAFEMGKTAATLLFKGIEKPGFNLSKERVVIPSSLQVRESTG
jgi:LacI family transcriptional regulator